MTTVQMKDGVEMYEQQILTIMRRLPPYRLLELVDFARFLDVQTGHPTEVNVIEDAWEQLLVKPAAKRTLRDMAQEARADYHAGRTPDIKITEQGELAPA